MFALGLAFLLFVGMQAMISIPDLGLSDSRGRHRIDFVRVRREPTTPETKRQLPDRVKPKAAPKSAPTPIPGVGAVQTEPIAFEAPVVEQSLELKGGLDPGRAPSDNDAVPLVRVEPVYPIQAAQRGIEGYVVVRFDINETGGVTHPKVIDAKPPGLFDRAALGAVKQWKYKPKVIDGKTRAVKGVKVSLKFELRD